MTNRTLLGMEDVHSEIIALLRPHFPKVADLIEDTDTFGLGEATAIWLRSQHFRQALKRFGTVFLSLRGDPVAIITHLSMSDLGIEGSPMLRVDLMEFRERSRDYFRGLSSFVGELTDSNGKTVATIIPLSFYHMNRPGGPKWTQDMPPLLVKEDVTKYHVTIPESPPSRRAAARGGITVTDSIEMMLGEIIVLGPDLRNETMLDTENWPEGTWAVADEREIIASFKYEEDANVFRTSFVNLRVHSARVTERYKK